MAQPKARLARVNKKYAKYDKTENKILTQNVAIGLDGRKHRRKPGMYWYAVVPVPVRRDFSPSRRS